MELHADLNFIPSYCKAGSDQMFIPTLDVLMLDGLGARFLVPFLSLTLSVGTFRGWSGTTDGSCRSTSTGWIPVCKESSNVLLKTPRTDETCHDWWE